MKTVLSESTEYPIALDITTSAGTVYVRRNVHETEREGITYYSYEETRMTPEEYQTYAAASAQADNEAIMDALIEIYDMIAEKEE